MDNLEKTALGLDANVAGALCYALGWVTGVAMLIMERENRFVRFHALQSTVVFGGLCALWVVGTMIPFFGWILSFLIIPPVSAVVWLADAVQGVPRRMVQAALRRRHCRPQDVE